MILPNFIFVSTALSLSFTSINGFTLLNPSTAMPSRSRNTIQIHRSSENDLAEQEQEQPLELQLEPQPMKLTSPMKFVGPYPTLPLHFPNLATSSQRERDVSGISLDFVLDTAANTNTINAQVSQELQLEDVGTALPGYNAAGAMDGGTTFSLGDSMLEIPTSSTSTDREVFMTNLTASALPVASPAAAGLMGVAFLNCFQGGVKFDWGNANPMQDSQPSVTFYGDCQGMEQDLEGMKSVPIQVIPSVLLPSVILKVNGKDVPALLDTGSPITVVNSAAAKIAGLDVVQLERPGAGAGAGAGAGDTEKKGGFANPFKKMADNFKAANSFAQAMQRGDVLTIAGAAGQAVDLLRTENAAKLSLSTSNDHDDDVTFSDTKIYVGDMPGLVALGGLEGASSPPAAILGMDVLKSKPSMLYRQNEVYF